MGRTPPRSASAACGPDRSRGRRQTKAPIQPVIGGLNEATMPTRFAAHDGWPATFRRRIPTRFGVSLNFALPDEFVRAAALIPAPRTSTRAFRTALPLFLTVTVTVVFLPTVIVRGVEVSV
jgi:hypothetical protein